MANIGNDMSDNVGQQMQEQGKDLAGIAKKQVRRGTRNITYKARKMAAKGAKTCANAIKNLGKILIKFLIHLLALISGPLMIAIVAAVIGLVAWNFLAEERGSNMGDDLDPAVQNPAIVDPETGITTALAMTEPQAVIDAYYKLMSTYSFTKEYKNKQYEFNDPNETQDFSGLRDYFERENNFYLSDDFIRMMDELLHDNSFYFPEQVIKPVFGEKMILKDQNGTEGKYYTSRLPSDFKTGDKSRLFDEDTVKGFADMIDDKNQLTASIGTDNVPSLIAQSQKPVKSEDADGTVTYALTKREVANGSVPSDAIPGLWDYGFGSVLQYQPDEKFSYIECRYTDVEVDIDKSVWIEGDDEDDGYWSDWSHHSVRKMSLDGISTTDELRAAIIEYLDGISTDTVRYTYNLPLNIEAILHDNVAWDMDVEPNRAEEAEYKSIYGDDVTNQRINSKIENAKDADIDKLQFTNTDLQNDYGNKGGGLYPIKIAVVNHAATFSGNIHYTILPAAGTECDVEEIPLEPNTISTSDHRDPVKVIKVQGTCSDPSVADRTLDATRDGSVFIRTPHIEETTAPWGFAYMQDYAEEYVNYVPLEYMEDRDFFLRTGLGTQDGSPENEKYKGNLKFLFDLGLLRPYNENIEMEQVETIDSEDMGDSNSDLYILSHLIACEAGRSKLDQLMVGAVFVNRVHSGRYPNTFWEVLTQPNQYSSYPSMYDKPSHQPTEEQIASAMQVISGEFSIPENVVGQSAKIQGTIYKIVDNGPGANTHYYCTGGNVAVSTVDRFGRPAPAASQLEALAKKLEGASPGDISVSNSSGDLSSCCFIGDSLTIGLDNSQGLTSKGATVIAKTGAGLSQIKQMVDNASIPSNVTSVYLLAGTNSCTINDSKFERQYQELLMAIGQKAPRARIILTSLPPCIDNVGHNASNAYIKAKNDIINKIASSSGMQIIDIWSSLQKDGSLDPGYSADGLHLTAAGYGVWFSQVKSGNTTSQIETEEPSSAYTNLDPEGIPIDSDYTLYRITNFDVLTAVNMQASISQADSSARSWLANLVGGIQNVVEDVVGFLAQFWNTVSDIVFPSQNDVLDRCFRIGDQYNSGDVRGVVYHTMTFNTQEWYSTAEDEADDKMEEGDITFLFVGNDAILGYGTLGYGTLRTMPGIATTLNGTISPTSTYYSAISGFDGTKVELNVPENTNILAVSDGKIIEVGNDPSNAKGRYVVEEFTIDGDTYQITYGYLNSISVSNGATVSKNDLIGTSGSRTGGTPSLYLQVRKNGSNVDPLDIFYQDVVTYGGGSLGGDLYNNDGTVDKEAIKNLEAQLSSIIGLKKKAYNISGYTKSMAKSQYLQMPINRLQGLQCTWWAWGRGYEYLCTIKNTNLTKDQFAKIINNGGGFYQSNINAGLFNYGSTPKPNSLVCYHDPGGPGHVAYVEAVDYENRVYYESECGAGKHWMGVNERQFGYAPHWHGRQYTLKGFIYLDEPRT